MSISPLFCRPRSLPGLRVLARVFSHQAGVLRRVLADEVTDVSDAEDFFRYTSGRWLWNEAAHLEERYKRFNIAELKQAAAEAAGAQSCSQITKLAEGGFNKVFKLVMDNDSVVVARIPNPDVGRVDRMIASEVATMEFATKVLGLPVPKVLSWSGDESNAVESAYILMEHARGTQLGDIWQDIEIGQKMAIVDEAVAIERKFSSVSFSCHGSLYFAADAFDGCTAAKITGHVGMELRDYVEGRFVVGPVAEKSFNGNGPQLDGVNRGPWHDAKGYLIAVAQRERSKLTTNERTADPESSDLQQKEMSILDKFEATCSHLPPRAPHLSRPTIWHWDVRPDNLFAKDGRITDIIDWQDTWIGPFFLQARRPRLVDHHGEVILHLPDHYKTIEDPEEKASVADHVEKSILLWCYERETKLRHKELHAIFTLPQAQKRKDTVAFTSELADGEVAPSRACLIELKRDWNQLDTGIECPIQFSAEELAAHSEDSGAWNQTAEFWSSLDGFVSRDGWTSLENYEKAKAFVEELREEGLKQLSGQELAEFEASSRWVVGKDRV